MTKTRKSTKTVGSKIILYTVLALIVFIVIGTASDRQMVSEASAITSEVVPSGVYALRNVRSGYYLNVSSYEEGTYVMVEDLGHVPSSAAERAYMFRIEQIGTTGRYAIRTMSNNYNSIMPMSSSKGSNMKSTEVARLNSQIESSKTWNITRTTNGYTLKPYGNSYYMTQYAATGTLAKMLAYSTYGTLSEWEIVPITSSFSGVGYYGGASSVQRDVAVGEQETVRAYFYSTNLNHTHITMSLRSADSSMASYTYDLASHSMTVTPSDIGMIRHQISIVNSSTNGKTTYVCEYVNIHLADGVYTFQNNYSGKYINFNPEHPIEFPNKAKYVTLDESGRKSMFKVKYYPKDGNVAEQGSYVIRSMYYNDYAMTAVDVNGNFYNNVSLIICDIDNQDVNNTDLTYVSENGRWKIEKTNDNSYVIIRNNPSDTEDYIICSKEYDRNTDTDPDASEDKDDDLWHIEASSSAIDRGKWNITRYTGPDFAGVENVSYGDYIVEGSLANPVTVNISSLFNSGRFYSTITDHSELGDIVDYEVYSLDGSQTSVATIDESGNLTVLPYKAGMIGVKATYQSFCGETMYEVESNAYTRVYITPPDSSFLYIQCNDNYPYGYLTDVNGTLQQSEIKYATNQLWRKISTSTGYYIQNVETGRCLTSPDSTGDSVAIELGEYNSSIPARQIWNFVQTPGAENHTYWLMQSEKMREQNQYLCPYGTNQIIQQSLYIDAFFYVGLVPLGNVVVIYGADTYDVPLELDILGAEVARQISYANNPNYASFGIHTYVNGSKDVAASLMDEARIYIHMAHGKSTAQKVNKKEGYVFSIYQFPHDLSDLDLAMFVGCETAASAALGNMIQNAVGKGELEKEGAAKVAIGFTKKLYEVTPDSDTPYITRFYHFFNTFFFELMENGSLERAIIDNDFYKEGNFDSIIVEYKEGVDNFSILPQD